MKRLSLVLHYLFIVVCLHLNEAIVVNEYNIENDSCVQVELVNDLPKHMQFVNFNPISKEIIAVKNDSKLVLISLASNKTENIWNFNGTITKLKVKWNYNRIYLIIELDNDVILYEIDIYFKFISILTRFKTNLNDSLLIDPQPLNGYVAVYTKQTLFFVNINFLNYNLNHPRWFLPNNYSFVNESSSFNEFNKCHINSIEIQSIIDYLPDDVYKEPASFFYANIPIDVDIYEKNKRIKCVFSHENCKCFSMKDKEKLKIIDFHEKSKKCVDNQSILREGYTKDLFKNCLRICPTPKYKLNAWKKTLVLQQEDQDENYIKYKLMCTNNLELKSIVGAFDYKNKFTLRLNLNNSFFMNTSCQNVHKRFKLIIGLIQLDSLENITNQSFDFNQTHTQIVINENMSVNLSSLKESFYMMKIWIQSLFDLPHEIGVFYVDLTSNKTNTGVIEANPYLYEHINYLKILNNEVSLTQVASDDIANDTLSYILTKVDTQETKYGSINENTVLISDLDEDTLYRMRILRNSQARISSLSNLLEFKTLKTPTFEVKTNEIFHTTLAIRIKCYYHLKDLSQNISITKGLLFNNICNYFIVKWRPFATNSTNVSHEWLFQKQYIFEGQLNFIRNKPSSENDYYFETNFKIPNLKESQRYEVYVSTSYYNDLSLNSDRIVFSTNKIKVPKMSSIQITIILIIVASFILVLGSILTFIILRRRMKKYDTHGSDLPLNKLQSEQIMSKMNTNGLYFWTEINTVLNKTELEKLKRIDKIDISLDKKIGSGTFGDVFEGKYKTTESESLKRVAIKILKSNSFTQVKIDLLKEAIALSLFSHPNLIEFYGICFENENDPKYIILEYMNLGDLQTYLRNERYSNKIFYKQAIEICLDVAKGCEFLEEKKIVHRDLAARNCLVMTLEQSDRDILVKIGDFGLARELYSRNYYKNDGNNPLPVRWMSPESLVDSIWTSKSDVWSYGVVIWEIMTMGQQPYPTIETKNIFEYVINGGQPAIASKCPHEMKDLMIKCWQAKPENRPTFRELVSEFDKIIDENNDIKWTLYDDCLPMIDDIYAASFKTSRYTEPVDSLLDQTMSSRSSTRPRVHIDSDYSIGADFLCKYQNDRASALSQQDSAISSQRKSSLINLRDQDLLVNLLSTNSE